MFNKEQQKAIETVEGQVVLIACPGSGKTTTLLARIHRMIESGIDPNIILMVTFTKAAADEMKKRFAKQYGDSPVTFCTIHSFCLAVLRKFCNMSKDCIVDPVEVRQFFYEQLFRHKEIADKERYLKDLLLDISRLKNSQCDLRYFKPNCGDKELFSKLYGAYEDWKVDMLKKVVIILDTKTGVRSMIIKKILEPFRHACEAVSRQLNPDMELMFSYDKGLDVYMRKQKDAEFIPISNISTGEFVFVAFVLMTVIGQLTQTHILVLDNLDSLDNDNLGQLITLLENDTTFQNVFMAAVNHTDTMKTLENFNDVQTILM